jgi:hypothetical protein
MNRQITARCRCGAVQFTSQRPPILQLSCHCKDCQESTRGPAATTAFFKAKYSAVSGPLAARAFNRTTRESCADCGSLMFDRSGGFPALIGVIAERISLPFVFQPECPVETRSQRPDAAISDDACEEAENVTPEAANNVLEATGAGA